MRCFPAWPMLLLLVAITLLPFADAFKGQGVLRRAKTIVKGIPAALRDIVNDIDVRVILEESTAEPASEVFWTTTQPEKEPVLQRVVRFQAVMAVEAPPKPIVPEAAHWSPVVFGDWPVVDETVAVTDGMVVCEEPGACAIETFSSVAPLDVAVSHVDDIPSCPWPPSLGFPDLEPASVDTARHPTSPATVAPFDDGGALCVWPPFLGVAEIDQTSPMPLCDEPGACAVASLSLMKPLNLVEMVERALLAEAGVAAFQQLIRVSQTERLLRDWDLSMVCFADRDSTQHYLFGFGNQFGFGSLMFFIQTIALDAWSGNGSAMLTRLTESLPSCSTFSSLTFSPGYKLADNLSSFPSVRGLFVFTRQRLFGPPIVSWPWVYFMNLALCAVLGCFWLLLILCRRLCPGPVGAHPVDSGRAGVDHRAETMWLAINALSNRVAGVEHGEAADSFKGLLSFAIDDAVAASEERMKRVFLFLREEERERWQRDTEKLVRRVVAEALKEDREPKWKKKLNLIEGRVLGSVNDRLRKVLTSNDEEHATAVQKAQLSAATADPDDEDEIEELLQLS